MMYRTKFNLTNNIAIILSDIFSLNFPLLRGGWHGFLLIGHLDFVILMCQLLKLQEGQTNYTGKGITHGLSKQSGSSVKHYSFLNACICTKTVCDPPDPPAHMDFIHGVPGQLKTSVRFRISRILSFYNHFSYPHPVIFAIYFWGTLATLTWSGVGGSSFWKTPTGLPSVCFSGRMGIPDF